MAETVYIRTFSVFLFNKVMGISKNLVGFLEMPDEFFISPYA